MTVSELSRGAFLGAVLVLVGLGWAAGAFVAAEDGLPVQPESEDGARRGAGGAASVELGDRGSLPWARPSASRPVLPAQRLRGPRELLEMFGIEQSQLESFFDGQPLGPDDEEGLIKILYRLPQFPLEDVHRWENSSPDWQAVVQQPEAARAEFFRLRGRVQRVERQELLPELAELFELDHYYQVTMQLDDAPYPVLLCARQIPAAWIDGGLEDLRASASGLFLKTGDDEGPHPQLVFAAHRVAWHPDRADPQRGITADHVLLGELGMDVGLFDRVRGRNRRPIGSVDREAFYHLLAAVGRADGEQLEQQAQARFSLAPLLQDPAAQHGRLLLITGTARRVTRIMVSDADVRERFGIDHYYQIDVFLPLGDQTVQLRGRTEGQPGPVYTNHYPATLCTLRLPPELEDITARLMDGTAGTETMNERITIAAFYFKLWAYRSEFAASFDPQQLQLSPMLVGLEPRLDPVRPLADPYFGLAVGVVFLMALAGVWLMLWRYNRSDTQFQDVLAKRRLPSDQPPPLNELDLPGKDEPDFRNL